MLDAMGRMLRRNRKYLLWKLRNPRGRFEDFYVMNVEKRIDLGLPHSTLGKLHHDPKFFDSSGRKHFEFLVALGLKSSHKLIDYGCGSLRLGRHAIPYLSGGCYLGLDVTDRFYAVAQNDLPSALLMTKRPRFSVINSASIDEFRSFGPDFIASIGVIFHVPKRNLPQLIGNIAALSKPGTRLLLGFREGRAYEQVAEMSWVYPREYLLSQCARMGFECDASKDNANIGDDNHRFLIMTYSDKR